MKSILVWTVAFVVSGMTPVCQAQIDPDTTGLDVTRQLLDEWWSGGVETRRAGEAAFRNYRASHPAVNPQVQWAYVLNRIEYDKYREAHAAIGELPRQAGQWDVQYTRIWLSLVVGEINPALLQLQEFKTALHAAGNLDDATRARMFGRMGRLFGFIEGPGSDRANPATVQETLAILLDNLDDVDFGNFEDQRKQVTQTYTGLLNEKSTTVAEQVRKKMQDNVTKRQQVSIENRQMEARQDALVNELQTIRSKANEALAELRRSAAPLRETLARMDSELALVESQIGRLYNEIAFIQLLAAQEPDPFLRANLMNRAFAFRRDLDYRLRDRNNLQGDYRAVAAQLDSVYSEIAAAEQQFRGQIGIREQESRQLQARQKKNLRVVARLNNPRAQTGYVRSIDARTGHLPTYDPFPAAELRHQALKRLP